MKLSERMEHVGQEAYEYAPEVAQLEAENAELKRENEALKKRTIISCPHCARFIVLADCDGRIRRPPRRTGE